MRPRCVWTRLAGSFFVQRARCWPSGLARGSAGGYACAKLPSLLERQALGVTCLGDLQRLDFERLPHSSSTRSVVVRGEADARPALPTGRP
jgi:hypothetical protein